MDSTNNRESVIRNSGRSKRVAWSAGAAAAALAAVFVTVHALRSPIAEDPPLTGTFATRMGEHRCERLPDSSRVCLNTNSLVRYAISRKTRMVELISGEASFEVQSRDDRPFDVISGRVVIRDLSTRFNVYKKDNSTAVTVTEGRVKVMAPVSPSVISELKSGTAESAWRAAPQLRRLQQAEFDETSGMLYVSQSLTEEDLTRLTAWERGRINLNGRTLTDALTEFSRYQPLASFSIPDRTLRNIRIGGELDSTNLMDFLAALEWTYGIHYSLQKSSDGQTRVTLSRQRVTPGQLNKK